MTSVKGASVKGTSIKGTSVKGTSVKGVSIKGASVKGTSVKGASVKGTSIIGISSVEVMFTFSNVFSEIIASAIICSDIPASGIGGFSALFFSKSTGMTLISDMFYPHFLCNIKTQNCYLNSTTILGLFQERNRTIFLMFLKF